MTLQKKRGKGKPKSAKAGNLESCIEKAEWEKSKFEADLVNNLDKYYTMYHDLAMGTGDFKKASITNRKGALEGLIARAESYTEEIVVEKESEVPDQDTKATGTHGQLISMDFTPDEDE